MPAVVAMRYEIPDRVALRFADEFYRMLLTGPQPGRVDQAVESARSLIYGNEPGTLRGFITPVLYLAEGHERLFVLAPPSRSVAPVVTELGSAPRRDVILPDDLLDALRENRCIPVIGPGLFTAGRGPCRGRCRGRTGPRPARPGAGARQAGRVPPDERLRAQRAGRGLDGHVRLPEGLPARLLPGEEPVRDLQDHPPGLPALPADGGRAAGGRLGRPRLHLHLFRRPARPRRPGGGPSRPGARRPMQDTGPGRPLAAAPGPPLRGHRARRPSRWSSPRTITTGSGTGSPASPRGSPSWSRGTTAVRSCSWESTPATRSPAGSAPS